MKRNDEITLCELEALKTRVLGVTVSDDRTDLLQLLQHIDHDIDELMRILIKVA